MTTKEQMRAEYPELADAVDFLRSKGATITRMSVHDEHGNLVSGREAKPDEYPIHVIEITEGMATAMRHGHAPRKGKK